MHRDDIGETLVLARASVDEQQSGGGETVVRPLQTVARVRTAETA